MFSLVTKQENSRALGLNQGAMSMPFWWHNSTFAQRVKYRVKSNNREILILVSCVFFWTLFFRRNSKKNRFNLMFSPKWMQKRVDKNLGNDEIITDQRDDEETCAKFSNPVTSGDFELSLIKHGYSSTNVVLFVSFYFIVIVEK